MFSKKNLVFTLLLTLWLAMPLMAQNISFSPGENGQLYPQLDLAWNYGASPFGSQIRLQSLGSSETDTDSPGAGLDQSVTTNEEHIFAEIVPLFYRFDFNMISLKPGLAVKGDWYDILEVGYQDVMLGATEYRLFFHNDRKILSIRPGLYAGADLETDFLTVKLDVFYSPFFFLQLNQIFSSAAEGTALLDTEETDHQFAGTGTNAWGCMLAVQWINAYVPITVRTAWEGFSLNYESIGIGEQTIDSKIMNINGSLEILASLDFVQIRNVSPMIGVGWSWDMTQDVDEGDWETENYPIQIFIGVSL